MRKKKAASKPDEPRIVTVRGQRVILDGDLAEMEGVEVRALNQAVKHNAECFPSDAEGEANSSQFVMSSRRRPTPANARTAA